MKLKTIKIEQLFGTYTYTIPLWEKESVTILHSPNGHGKTTILKLVEAIMEGNLLYIDETPFLACSLAFGNGTVVSVRKKEVFSSILEQDSFQFRKIALCGDEDALKLPFVYEITDKNGQMKTYPISLNRDVLMSLSKQMALGRSRLEASVQQEIPSLKTVILQEKLEDEIFDIGELYILLLKYKLQCNIHIIEANRVFKHVNLGSDKVLAESVQIYAKELGEHIAIVKKKAGELAEKLDQTFPRRVLETVILGNETYILEKEEINKRLKQLQKQRQNLIDSGILMEEKEEKDNSLDWLAEEPLSKDTRCFLTIYIEDNQEKLDCYDKLKKKLEILLQIINVQNGFSNKKMKIEGSHGAVFYMDNGMKVPLTKLSSGEKNDFVLFYELIFRCDETSLILIDEPEISLHIAWQQEFIRQLIRICRINQMQAVVATHSPNIVDEYWDLLVDLEGEVEM